MSRTDSPPAAREAFHAILDRMQLLGDDFTSHAEDHELILALAGARGGARGPAGDILHDDYCAQLDLSPGATYRVAARKLAEVLRLEAGPEAG